MIGLTGFQLIEDFGKTKEYLMFTFCVQLLTGVEAVRREVGHVWQQSKLWQTCHLVGVDGGQFFPCETK